MKSDCKVTVWHFENDREEPERKVFCGVLQNGVKKITKNGIKQKGFYFGDTLNVRIFTDKEIGIAPGDYLSLGEDLKAFPDREYSQKIVEVRDNRRGANKHWRIICGG